MKLLVFGATGATGQHLVQLALSQGHRVTAFVRDPNRLITTSAALTLVVGDVMELSSVETAPWDQDAVLCALGTMPEGTVDRARRQPDVPVCSVGTKNILEAMSRHRCRRIVVQTSTSVGDSRRTGTFGAAFFVHKFLGQIMADKEMQEAAVRASDLDWTIVRPVKMTDEPAKGNVQYGERLRWSMLSSISRADTAAFMLSAVSDLHTIHKALTVKSGTRRRRGAVKTSPLAVRL
jgi:uncharacterized protein YbjT (DUF2867 family)